MKDRGNCYQAAAEYLLDHGNRLGPAARLVHGMVSGQGPVAGMRFGHAWVEVGEEVIDPSNGRLVRLHREHYYFLGQIREAEITRYSHAETREKLLDFLHYGPWENKHPCGRAARRKAISQVPRSTKNGAKNGWTNARAVNEAKDVL